MVIAKEKELLKDDRVRQEIDKYKWVESEKAGHDIGFDKAANDWLKKFSKTWLKTNTSSVKKPTRRAKRIF
jgi:hypothetical protein